MTAKEMFEQLGFTQKTCLNEKLPENAYIEYEWLNDDKTIKREITFFQKMFFTDFCCEFVEKQFNSIGSFGVTNAMLKAITQQMKELGWFDE